MILRVHVPGAADHAVGDEIWQRPLSQVLAEQAEIVTDDIAGGRLDHDQRNALLERVAAEMTEALVNVGDSYRAPDGVQYSLIDEAAGLLGGRTGCRPGRPSRRSSKRSWASRSCRSARRRAAVSSCVGATAPRVRPFAITTKRSWCAKGTCSARRASSCAHCTSAATATGCGPDRSPMLIA
jgi:hypothetical protein